MRHSPQDRAAVAGLRASGMTHKQIAQRTGIPRTSVSYILAQAPVAAVVERATVEQVSASLWAVVAAGTDEALRRIANPRTRAGEIAQLVKVAAEQYSLLNGGVTSRAETLSFNADLTDVPFTRDDVRSEVLGLLASIENATDEDLAAHEQQALQAIEIARGLATYDPEDRR
jgi:hypothetical protein